MSRDSTQLLSMALVLGGSEISPSKEILYADYINSAAAVGAFNSLVDLGAEGGVCKNTRELIDTNDSLMSATNSSKFYTGTEAQRQFSNMETIGFKFDQIAQYVNNTTELSEIENGIKQYNEKLTKLKANCRKKLLQNYADQFNEEKHEWEGFPKTKSYTYRSDMSYEMQRPEDDQEFDFCIGDNSEQYETELIGDIKTTKHEDKDADGYVYYTYYTYKATYRIHKYKYIKHWNFFKGWDTWFDPDVAEIEALYAKVGADLPYDPALIIGPDAE